MKDKKDKKVKDKTGKKKGKEDTAEPEGKKLKKNKKTKWFVAERWDDLYKISSDFGMANPGHFNFGGPPGPKEVCVLWRVRSAIHDVANFQIPFKSLDLFNKK